MKKMEINVLFVAIGNLGQSESFPDSWPLHIKSPFGMCLMNSTESGIILMNRHKMVNMRESERDGTRFK
jgi:hypothetical protein